MMGKINKDSIWNMIDKLSKLFLLISPIAFMAVQGWLDVRYAKADDMVLAATKIEVSEMATRIRSEVSTSDDILRKEIDRKFSQIICLLRKDDGFVWLNDGCFKAKGEQ